jgi:hypothetical protein
LYRDHTAHTRLSRCRARVVSAFLDFCTVNVALVTPTALTFDPDSMLEDQVRRRRLQLPRTARHCFGTFPLSTGSDSSTSNMFSSHGRTTAHFWSECPAAAKRRLYAKKPSQLAKDMTGRRHSPRGALMVSISLSHREASQSFIENQIVGGTNG